MAFLINYNTHSADVYTHLGLRLYNVRFRANYRDPKSPGLLFLQLALVF